MKKIEENDNSGNQPHPRSNSTRVKPIQSKTEAEQKENAAPTGSLQHQRQAPDEEATQLQQQKYSKLTSQNISQPRRREPTSRVAPKNQVSGMNHNQNPDTSILSTNMSFQGAGNSSMVQSSHKSSKVSGTGSSRPS